MFRCKVGSGWSWSQGGSGMGSGDLSEEEWVPVENVSLHLASGDLRAADRPHVLFHSLCHLCGDCKGSSQSDEPS